jgi:hypothetical protein
MIGSSLLETLLMLQLLLHLNLVDRKQQAHTYGAERYNKKPHICCVSPDDGVVAGGHAPEGALGALQRLLLASRQLVVRPAMKIESNNYGLKAGQTDGLTK